MAKNENSNFSYMTRRIGGTTYKVKVVFSDTEKETMEDKILRMIRNETVTTGATALSIRKNTSKAMPIRKVIRTVSTIPMTVGVEEILSVPLGNSLLQTSKRAKLLMSL